MKDKLLAFLRERIGPAAGAHVVPGGPSFAYVFGWVLVMLIAVEAVTGVALAMFYAPTTTDAWASVAYVQDQVSAGWLVRGLHYHGGSALVIIAGTHLLVTMLRGAYNKPRELVWWLGILLYAILLGWAVTGFVLRWDQAGYAANGVEIGIAAGTPVVGDDIRHMALSGNDYGNLTLTRFYALHALVMPALAILLVVAHIALARRHGLTRLPQAAVIGGGPPKTRSVTRGGDVPAWPAQTLRTALAMAAVFGVLLVYTIAQHGTDLAAPADPSATFDARPLWYFRWLYEVRQLAGSLEKPAAMIVPALVAGYFVALPRLGLRGRFGGLAILVVVMILTALSFWGDAHNDDLDKRAAAADALAAKALRLARENGVPATGALDVYTTPPMYRARSLFAQRCATCHDADSKDRKGPIIAPGHGNRAWLTGFLKAPAADAYWAHTKLGPTDDGMGKVELPDLEMSQLVELLYAESGAPDVDVSKRDAGKVVFKKMSCGDCHSIDEGVAGSSGPGLAGLDSRDYYTSFISNPKSPIHMNGDDPRSLMPRFDKELSIVDRDLIAEYLVWLRTATPEQLRALGDL